MSTVRTDNFGPSAGGTTYSARGVSKAWVNFNGTGTIAARDSENVSSLTDNATGDYTVNFTNAFGAADYATTVSTRRYSAAISDTAANDNVCAPDNLATGSMKLFSFSISGRGAIDSAFLHVTAHGDLA
jgi:hypothetical protein